MTVAHMINKFQVCIEPNTLLQSSQRAATEPILGQSSPVPSDIT
jgi:hypothetical protein